jgi:hypothetical protein
MGKYTKGPRTVYAPIDGFTNHWIVECDAADLLVTIEGGNNPSADAYLIAAAPELLEACERGGRYSEETGPELLHRAGDILSAFGYEELAIDLRLKADEEQNAIRKVGVTIDE